MSKSSNSLGKRGEAMAAQALESKGFIILDRNWHCREGELDLIAQEGDVIVFVEVKSRRSQTYGSPEEALTWKKSSRIVKTARAYLNEMTHQDPAWRIDVIAIEFDLRGNLQRLTHYENAITGDEVSWE